jgi:hypothetical protein
MNRYFALTVLSSIWLLDLATAQSPPAAETLDVVLDRRTNTAVSEIYFVAFCSIGKLTSFSPGHAFVLRGSLPKGAVGPKRVVDAWGLWPRTEGEVAIIFSTVSGRLKEEYTKGNVPKDDCRLMVLVDEGGEIDKRISALRDSWRKSSDDDNVYRQNCIDYTDAIAAALELNRPSRSGTQLPAAYIRELARNHKSQSVVLP